MIHPRFVITGCGRSGTTFAAWLLSRHPQIAVANHNNLFLELHRASGWFRRGRHFVPSVLGIDHRPEEAGAAAVAEPLSLDEVLETGDVLASFRPAATIAFERIAALDGQVRSVGLRSPECWMFPDLVRAISPGIRFLNIVRDPRAVLASMRAAERTWASPGDFPIDPSGFATELWLPYCSAARSIDEHGDGLTVGFEELLEDGPSTFEKIVRWLGLEASPDLCEKACRESHIDRLRGESTSPKGFYRQGLTGGWRTDLSRKQVRQLESAAGAEMEAAGYPCVERKGPAGPSPPSSKRPRRPSFATNLALALLKSRAAAPALRNLRRLARRLRDVETDA